MEGKSQKSKQKGGEERMKHKTKKIKPSLLKAIKREVAGPSVKRPLEA